MVTTCEAYVPIDARFMGKGRQVMEPGLNPAGL